MPENETVLDRVQKFLDAIDQDGYANISYENLSVGAELMWADVHMLLALARANMDIQGNKEFLNSAERAVKGWRRANTNQIETIGRLQEELRQQRLTYKELNRSFGEARSEIATLKREAAEAEEWQNEVASLIPEDAPGINPEGAQEGIILDYIKYLQEIEKRVGKIERELEDERYQAMGDDL